MAITWKDKVYLLLLLLVRLLKKERNLAVLWSHLIQHVEVTCATKYR